MGGVWNDNIYCRADCTQDIHIDMNVQMQYLLAKLWADQQIGGDGGLDMGAAVVK